VPTAALPGQRRYSPRQYRHAFSGTANTYGLAGGTNGQQYNNLTVRIGAEGTDGITLNVKGPGLINVNQSTAAEHGDIMQIGALNMTNSILSLSGGNGYRVRVVGTTTVGGARASFQTNSDGPSGLLELAGQIVGAGSLNKLTDGTLRAIIINGTNNTYSGGTNIIGGEIQVTATTGTALGSGNVTVFPQEHCASQATVAWMARS